MERIGRIGKLVDIIISSDSSVGGVGGVSGDSGNRGDSGDSGVVSVNIIDKFKEMVDRYMPELADVVLEDEGAIRQLFNNGHVTATEIEKLFGYRLRRIVFSIRNYTTIWKYCKHLYDLGIFDRDLPKALDLWELTFLYAFSMYAERAQYGTYTYVISNVDKIILFLFEHSDMRAYALEKIKKNGKVEQFLNAVRDLHERAAELVNKYDVTKILTEAGLISGEFMYNDGESSGAVDVVEPDSEPADNTGTHEDLDSVTILGDGFIMRLNGRTNKVNDIKSELRKEFEVRMNEQRKHVTYATGGNNAIYFDSSDNVYVATEYDEILKILKENATSLQMFGLCVYLISEFGRSAEVSIKDMISLFEVDERLAHVMIKDALKGFGKYAYLTDSGSLCYKI